MASNNDVCYKVVKRKEEEKRKNISFEAFADLLMIDLNNKNEPSMERP